MPVDWQVEAQPARGPPSVLRAGRARPPASRARCRSASPRTTGCRPRAGGSTQTHRARAGCSGCPPATRARSPASCGCSPGAATGVLLAQQTAANLHAQPGDTRRDRPRRRPRRRACGSTASSTCPRPTRCSSRSARPSAPSRRRRPTTCPAARSATFDARRARRAGRRTQVHARSRTALPGSPSAAYTQCRGARAQPRDAARGRGPRRRQPRHGARPGAPGRALRRSCCSCSSACPARSSPALVTASIAAAGARPPPPRRRAAAHPRRVDRASSCALALAETALAGGVGRRGSGSAARSLIGAAAFGTASFGAGTLAAVLWAGGAALAGLAIAAAAIALPAWRDARALTVAGQRRAASAARDRAPWWARYGLDFVALAGAGARLLAGVAQRLPARARARGRAAGLGQLVRAAGARCWLDRRRAARLPARRPRARARTRGRSARALRPLAGELVADRGGDDGPPAPRCSPRAVALVALTAAFAGSTAVFNSTYQQQAEVDARLTNGADVTVTESPGARRRRRRAPARLAAGRRASRSVEPLQHRFAYVGADLQDLYGVRPATIGAAGKLQDALVRTAAAPPALMAHARAAPRRRARVAPRPSSDFQLHPGDLLRLRLQDGRTKQLHDRAVPLRRRGEGVPDRADRLVPRRQRRLRRAGRPAATRSARSSSRPTARARRPSRSGVRALVGHRARRSPTSPTSAGSSAPT